MQKRVNGFQRPFTNDQIISWIAEPAAAAVFYLIVAPFTFDGTRTALLTVYSICLVLHIFCWYYCSAKDPAQDGGFYWPCMKEAQKESRYCAVCQKHVKGLDHHCTWLNTCIGKRQYWAFFFLVVIGTFMFWFQSLMIILILTAWRDEQVEEKAVDILGSVSTFKILTSLGAVYSLILAISLSVLFVFHIFLQFQGVGTYSWLLDSRSKKMGKRKEPSTFNGDQGNNNTQGGTSQAKPKPSSVTDNGTNRNIGHNTEQGSSSADSPSNSASGVEISTV